MKTFHLFILAPLMLLFVSCEMNKPIETSFFETGTFRVSILYSNEEGAVFDMDYYEQKNMPMVAEFIGNNLRGYEIDKGVVGRTSDEAAPFVAIGYFYIDDLVQYQRAISQNRDSIIKDFKNYTTIQPVIQISKIQRGR